MTNGEDAGNMLDITSDPRERFPSGTRVTVNFPPPVRHGSTIWIDGDCFAEANDLIAQFKSGKLTARDAESAIRELAYELAARQSPRPSGRWCGCSQPYRPSCQTRSGSGQGAIPASEYDIPHSAWARTAVTLDGHLTDRWLCHIDGSHRLR